MIDTARLALIGDMRISAGYVLAAVFAALWLIAIADWGAARPRRRNRW